MARFPIPEHLAKITFPLWDGPAPLSRGNAPDDIPTLTPFWPERTDSPAPVLIIFPGGGYMEHAFDEEIFRLIERFRKQGFAVFLLRYRLASDGYCHPAQLLDAQRAVRVVRQRAVEWNLDPTRLAIMGFSAGGHLASMVGTHFDEGNPLTDDPVERCGCCPDAAILVYPVISFVSGLTGSGGSMNLLDPKADLEALADISSELAVTAQTPPTLLIHGEDDQTVPVAHSQIMFDALQKAGVAVEFHVYPMGKHGFGCFTHDPQPPGWLERVEEWLVRQDFLNKK